MAISKSNTKIFKYGFTNSKKKCSINLIRFFFHGRQKNNGQENEFYIEFELLNPYLSANTTVLGFKSRLNLSEEDLHSVLAGTSSAYNLESEQFVQPSYVALRICKLGVNQKILSSYLPINLVKFNQKPFSISFLNNLISEDSISGLIEVTSEELQEKPELMCNSGLASWNLKYDVMTEGELIYKNKNFSCAPIGLKTNFVGAINFDGIEYIVEPYKSFGYIEKVWGKEFPEKWFHVSSSDMTSLITGKDLYNSSFTVNGVFENRISLIVNIEGQKIAFSPKDSERSYNSVFDCVQSPHSEGTDDESLHWSTSVNNKNWVIDIDLFCPIKDLFNRFLECPQGKRVVLNEVESSRGLGEIKIYKKKRDILEQIEYAKINKAFCEFGNIEEKDS